jgi:hypothetical protein
MASHSGASSELLRCAATNVFEAFTLSQQERVLQGAAAVLAGCAPDGAAPAAPSPLQQPVARGDWERFVRNLADAAVRRRMERHAEGNAAAPVDASAVADEILPQVLAAIPTEARVEIVRLLQTELQRVA